ncbi:hypothetical protein SELR_pSRC300800 (plasmid) [Selenomonas ruminantium subsp. lactilytica TAM6421]|uniref:Uncharacterized protein n=1 Tax=Selenomonas ruminantium subsp. lactilytica (strain NBRC 103574 / TAM6421) TaxID=927704 RepID=I0GWL6_SELRL|nr:hypothetical protein SELR_pSRC300800 [Selenomonas ruminantium subsp. lactilytica TAM6421]
MKTNADWIRSMSDLELAIFLDYILSCDSCDLCPEYDTGVCDGECATATDRWLKREHTED